MTFRAQLRSIPFLGARAPGILAAAEAVGACLRSARLPLVARSSPRILGSCPLTVLHAAAVYETGLSAGEDEVEVAERGLRSTLTIPLNEFADGSRVRG
jgi:hypothetical protein